MRGIIITFEGIDGAGKTTQTSKVYQGLSEMGYKCVALREPGGNPVSEKIRGILLDNNNEISDKTEIFLYCAARSQMVDSILTHYLDNGYIVLLDRYVDSSLAYQGFGRGIDLSMIMELNNYATCGRFPDLTFVLDIDVDKTIERKGGLKKDRIELAGRDFIDRVREGYLNIKREGLYIINADRYIEDIYKDIMSITIKHLEGWNIGEGI